VSVTRNYLKPTFNVFGYFASAGLNGNQLIASTTGGAPILVPGGLSQELTAFIHFKYPEYAAGFSLTIPIRNRSALADNMRAQILEQQAQISVQDVGNQIGIQVRSAISSLVQDRAQVAAAEEAVTFSRQSLETEQKRLAEGISTAYNVTLAQRNLLNAQLAEVQARAAYAQALVELDRSRSVLLQKSHIDVDEAVRGRVSQ